MLGRRSVSQAQARSPTPLPRLSTSGSNPRPDRCRVTTSHLLLALPKQKETFACQSSADVGVCTVLYANAHPSMSHVSPAFAPVFGNCLRALRKVVYTETAQPFIIAGSGTLGW